MTSSRLWHLGRFFHSLDRSNRLCVVWWGLNCLCVTCKVTLLQHIFLPAHLELILKWSINADTKRLQNRSAATRNYNYSCVESLKHRFDSCHHKQRWSFLGVYDLNFSYPFLHDVLIHPGLLLVCYYCSSLTSYTMDWSCCLALKNDHEWKHTSSRDTGEDCSDVLFSDFVVRALIDFFPLTSTVLDGTRSK